jgi:hypothetical protein
MEETMSTYQWDSRKQQWRREGIGDLMVIGSIVLFTAVVILSIMH